MSRAIWPMPVSVEQIAVVVRQMSPEEQRRLVELAPELRRVLAPVRTLLQAIESARVLKAMRRDLQPPYDRVALPRVLRPEEILPAGEDG